MCLTPRHDHPQCGDSTIWNVLKMRRDRLVCAKGPAYRAVLRICAYTSLAHLHDQRF